MDDGWIYRWTDGWMDEQIDKQIDRQIDRDVGKQNRQVETDRYSNSDRTSSKQTQIYLFTCTDSIKMKENRGIHTAYVSLRDKRQK